MKLINPKTLDLVSETVYDAGGIFTIALISVLVLGVLATTAILLFKFFGKKRRNENDKEDK